MNIFNKIQITKLRCEYRENPLGIEMVKPRLGWVITSRNREVVQTAYNILVASSLELLNKGKGDLWDSGKVLSEESNHISYSGAPLVSSQQLYWKVRSWLSSNGDTPTPWSKPANWTMGILSSEEWKAKWIQFEIPLIKLPENRNLCPWMRKSFELKAVPERAVVYLNVVGYVELYINGKKVGSDVLAPAVADPKRQSLYLTYDVTKYLTKGKNVVALWMCGGWAIELPLARVQLNAWIEGKTTAVVSDESWKGKVSYYERLGLWSWGNFGGESLDARAQSPDWNLVAFDDNSWTAVNVTTPPPGIVTAQQAPLNRIGEIVPAVKVSNIGEGLYEIDFGRNLTGWLNVKMPQLKLGQKIILSFADARNVEAKRGTSGYQTFNQISEFISAGGKKEIFQNKFNYAGFRYVIVEGLSAIPRKENFTAMMIESEMELTGSFKCSNDLFNKIHQMTHWTQRCLNQGGYYVDCPTRERLGYGDGQVATEGFMSNFGASEFYRKWLRDWRIRQEPNGKMPNVAPTQNGGGGPAWAGLLAAITYRHYLYYGDKEILTENFDTINQYVNWLEEQCQAEVLKKYGGKWDFIGDWVPPERGMDTDNWPNAEMAEFFNNCYRIYQIDLLRKIATVIGKTEDVIRLEERLKTIRPIVHANFFDKENQRYIVDEQSYYLMPLLTAVTPESEKEIIFQNLENNIKEKNKGHFDTGMLGTYFLMEYLREIGRNDLVAMLMNQKTYPSFGYMVESGATTCWEQWNGYWSHIHSCYTSADNWFYQGAAGIVADPNGPGFKKFIIKPAIVNELTWVKSHYESTYGKIVSNWKREGSILTMEVTVPVNTTAKVYIPSKNNSKITESGKPIENVRGLKFIKSENNVAVYEVGSGSYQFESEIPLVQIIF